MNTCYIFGQPNTTTVYVSRNADYLPHPPPINAPSKPIANLLRPRFLYDDYYYVAFVPQQTQYDGPLFGCLNPLAATTETTLQEGRSCHQLVSDQRAQWQALELVTVQLRRRLVERAGGVYLETVFPPLPSTFRYAEPWPTEHQLLTALSQARNAFTLQFALISCLRFNEEKRKRATWEELSEGPHALPLAYCNAFRVSWIADFDVPRIGGFVDITRAYRPDSMCVWHEIIEGILARGDSIPLWFAYDGQNTRRDALPTLPSPTLQVAKAVIPDRRWVLLVQAKADAEWTLDNEDRARPLSEGASYTVSRMGVTQNEHPSYIIFRRRAIQGSAFQIVNVGNTYDFVKLQEVVQSHASLMVSRFRFNNRQKQGETFEDFMTRTGEEQWAWRLRESDDERMARQYRETKHRDQPVPIGATPAVYQWTAQDKVDIRSLVNPRHVETLWEKTMPSDRHYNAFRHEYDIDNRTVAQDDTEDQADGDSKADENIAHRRNQKTREASPVRRERHRLEHRRRSHTPSSAPWKPEQDPLCDHPFESYDTLLQSLDTLLAVNTIHPATEALNPRETFANVVAARYGFMAPSTAEEEKQEEDDIPTCIRNIQQMYGEILDRHALPERDVRALNNFARLISEGTLPPQDLFAYHPLRANEDTSPTTTNVERVDACKGASFIIRAWISTSEGQGDESEWAVGVTGLDLQHARRGGGLTSPYQILTETVARGGRVHQLWRTTANTPVRATTTSYIDGRPMGVGVKPHGSDIGSKDYVLYKRQRDDFLATGVGKLALQRGGIAWRLAREAIDGEDTVFSHRPDELNANVDIVNTGGQLYAKGELSDEQLYLISGVYRVLTRAYRAHTQCLNRKLTTTMKLNRTHKPQ